MHLRCWMEDCVLMWAERAPAGDGASEGGEPGNDSLLPNFTTLPPGGSMSHEFVEEEDPGDSVRRDTTRYREPPLTVYSTHTLVNRWRIVYCGQIGLQGIFRAMERPAANVFLDNVTPRKQNASCFFRRHRFRYSRSSEDGTMSRRGRGRTTPPMADSAAPAGRHDPFRNLSRIVSSPDRSFRRPIPRMRGLPEGVFPG